MKKAFTTLFLALLLAGSHAQTGSHRNAFLPYNDAEDAQQMQQQNPYAASEVKACTDLFLSLVRINSQSHEPDRPDVFPLSDGQREVARFVEQYVSTRYADRIRKGELTLVRSEQEYIYITLPATTQRPTPSVMFMAHLDVTPEAPGGDIRPIVHRDYRGGALALPAGITIDPARPEGKHLADCLGKTIVTSDGSTLLGADDKAGCTALLGLLDQLMASRQKHGTVYIVLSQNEDIGMAAHGFEMQYVGGKSPDMIIDVDGSQPDEYAVGNFTAVLTHYLFHGTNAHPGSAKEQRYGDALTAASTFIGQLSPNVHPSASEGQQGYIHCYSLTHPHDAEGKEITTDYVVSIRLRYFDAHEGDTLRQMMDRAARYVAEAYPFVQVEAVPETMQYENVAYSMHPALPALIAACAEEEGHPVRPMHIRGGTTAAMMAARGLNGGPCLYSGQQNAHSCHEWACIEDIIDVTRLCQRIVAKIAAQ